MTTELLQNSSAFNDRFWPTPASQDSPTPLGQFAYTHGVCKVFAWPTTDMSIYVGHVEFKHLNWLGLVINDRKNGSES